MSILTSGQDLKPSEYFDYKNGIPYLTGASNLTDENIIINRWTNVPKAIALRGNILLTCKGTIGLTFILNDCNKVHIARQFMSICPVIIFNKFVKIIIDSYSSRLKENATSMIPGISRDEVLKLLVALPPLEEQKRIVSVVENLKNQIADINNAYNTLSAKIAQTKSKLLDLAIRGKLLPQNPNDEPASALLERIRREQEATQNKRKSIGSYIFKGEDKLYYRQIKEKVEFIGDDLPFDIPNNWYWAQFSDVCNLYTGNSIPKDVKAKRYSNLKEGYNYIGTKDVGFDSSINYENGVKIPYNNDNFKIAPANSVLLCIEGGSAGKKIGMTTRNVCFGNKLCCFYSERINSNFIYFYLQSPTFKNLFRSAVMGLIGGVGTNTLEKMYIPIPPLIEQERISNYLKSAFEHLDRLVQK